ncbi:YcjF family protein [Vibrio astriarenae]|uniref:YcjF family protein n=1 Tax=Vibrio astriarenae TaxID=1481923 RepID=UPI0037365366
MFEKIKEFINPNENPDLTKAHEYQRQHLPTLWLLGKTGAGKSSLIQALTGETSAQIGNGFEPCTLHSSAYDYPGAHPVIRFLDSRGLGEAGYQPDDDIALLSKTSHALVVVMKLGEVEQSAVLNALKQIRKQKRVKHLLLVHTAAQEYVHEERQRLIDHQKQQVKETWGGEVDSIDVDFCGESGEIYHQQDLLNALTQLLPVVGLMMDEDEHANAEEQNFSQLEKEVLWYSGTASASDLIPAVGLVSVPAIQGKMLHSLANQYGVDWNKRAFSELVGALGTSVAVQYSVKLASRQIVKLIPGYGQTVGAITAAAMSFGTTYGLGRAACYYFYHKSKGEAVSVEQMQSLYRDALKKGKAASGYEKD